MLYVLFVTQKSKEILHMTETRGWKRPSRYSQKVLDSSTSPQEKSSYPEAVISKENLCVHVFRLQGEFE